MKKIFNQSFFAGLLVVLPMATTLWLVFGILNLTDDFLALFIPKAYVPLTVPGLGLLVTLVFILSVGFVARNMMGRFLLHFIERMFSAIPFVNRVYITVKQVLETFLKEKNDRFNSVVLVEYPTPGIWTIGFATSELPADFNKPDHSFVFVPTTPNPTSGFLLIFEKKKIRPLSISVEDAFKMIISVGVVHPDKTS